jgi:Tol biopolymer transport system component
LGHWDIARLPSFSPDGNRIIFNSADFDKDIKLINPDGTDERTLVALRTRGGPGKFSSDSQRVLYRYRGDLYVTDVNGTNRTRLTNFNSQDLQDPYKLENQPYVANFCWSPDGKEITFVVREKAAYQFKFYSINSDGSGVKEIAKLDNPDQEGYIGGIDKLQYSPNGKKIAFIIDVITEVYIYIYNELIH